MASPASAPPEPPVAPPPPLWRVLRSFGFAFEGLATMLRTQPNFVVHVIAALLAIALGVTLGLSAPELALIVLTIVIVLVLECVNTAMESLADLVSPGFHPLIKRAKDVSAAGVLVAASGSVVIAILLFVPHLAR